MRFAFPVLLRSLAPPWRGTDRGFGADFEPTLPSGAHAILDALSPHWRIYPSGGVSYAAAHRGAQSVTVSWRAQRSSRAAGRLKVHTVSASQRRAARALVRM